MRALLSVLVVLVACNDPPGITLEVMRTHVNDRVTTVELFIGQDCHDCPPQFAPINQDGQQLLPRATDMWIVNDPAVFDGLWDGDAAQFRLISSTDQDEYVPIIVAVGYDANHLPTSTVMLPRVTIPVGYGEHWRAYLEEAKELVDPYTRDVERIAVWPRQRTGPQCITLEHTFAKGDTLVPADDTDCDGLPAPECAPFVANAHLVSPTIENTSCITRIPSNEPTPLCLLGGTPCNEAAAVQPGTVCESHQIDYCVSEAFCNNCSLINGYFGMYDVCMKPRILQNFTGSGPFVKCNVPIQMNGDACPNASTNEGEIDFEGVLMKSNGATKCHDLQLSQLTLPLAFEHNLKLGGSMALTIKDPHDQCRATLVWSGTAPIDPGNPSFTRQLLADLDLDNGKHIVATVLLYGVNDCSKSLTCDPVLITNTSDSVLSCAKPTTDTMTCLPSGGCNEGVACGSHCCGPGESCRDGVCLCGDGPHCVDTPCVDPNAPAPTITGCGIVCQ